MSTTPSTTPLQIGDLCLITASTRLPDTLHHLIGRQCVIIARTGSANPDRSDTHFRVIASNDGHYTLNPHCLRRLDPDAEPLGSWEEIEHSTGWVPAALARSSRP